MGSDHLLSGLNEAQSQAVGHGSGPLLVVAGPGSGKTRVLTARIARLIEDGSPGQGILAVTFTNKAAAEMRERLAVLLGAEASRRVWMGTFHSVCLRMLRRHPAAAGLADSFCVVDADDARKIVRQCLIDLGMPAAAADAREFHGIISRAKNDGMTPEALESTGRLRHAVEVFAAYQEALSRAQAVDFDDILTRAVRLLEEDARVRDRYQDQFEHILVDEFQDTNLVQYRLVQILGARSRNVCVVGDPDQSIYSWRGSRPNVVADFLADFAPVRQVVLAENYRSTPQVVDACNTLLAGFSSAAGRVLTTSNAPGEPVHFPVFGDDRDEVTATVDSISRRPLGESVAVICRTNAQTRPFEEALMSRGIPYAVVGSLRFYERAEVRDALAYVRCASYDTDVMSLSRIFNTPRRGLGNAAWEALATQVAATGSIRAALAELSGEEGPRRYRAGFQHLSEALGAVSQGCSEGPDAALEAVMGPAGLVEHYVRQAGDGPDRKANLGELLSAARLFWSSDSSALTLEGTLVKSLPPSEATRAFLDSTALASGSDADSEGARVVLTTAHAAKGREFDHVYVVGVEDGLFPHSSSEDMAEERRLLFVAFSRARLSLTVSRARQRMTFGNKHSASPSPFLAPFKGRSEPPRPAVARATRTLAPSYRLGVEDALPGAVVAHHVFGPGVVVNVDDLLVTVEFGDVVRQLRLDMAPLRLATPQQ